MILFINISCTLLFRSTVDRKQSDGLVDATAGQRVDHLTRGALLLGGDGLVDATAGQRVDHLTRGAYLLNALFGLALHHLSDGTTLGPFGLEHFGLTVTRKVKHVH